MEYWVYSTKYYRIEGDLVEHWSNISDKWVLAVTSALVIIRDGRKITKRELPRKMR